MANSNKKNAIISVIAVILVLVLSAGAVLGIGYKYGWFDKEDNVVVDPDTTDDTEEPDDTDDTSDTETPSDTEAEADFYYNGKAMYFDCVYYMYLSETYGSGVAESCYYINSSGEEVYIYTAEDLENGLDGMKYTQWTGKYGCDGTYAFFICTVDSVTCGLTYCVTNHYYSNGKCMHCGAAEE